MALTQTEANTLAKAGIAVAELYDFDVAKEAVVWGNLIIAGASIYGPKVIGAMLRKKAEGARNVTPPPQPSFQAPVSQEPAQRPHEWQSPFMRAEAPQTPTGANPADVKIGPDHFK